MRFLILPIIKMDTAQKEFQQIMKRFTTLLKKYKHAYTSFLEFRDNDTTQTRYFSNRIKTIESQLQSILHHLQNTSKQYDRNVRLYTGFLNRQNATLLSKRNTVNVNHTQIKHDDERAKSKHSSLENSNTLLESRKQKIKIYMFIDFLLILLLFVLFSFFRFKK